MTREEAIDVIVNDIDTYTIREGLALNMAIKALEQETRWIPVSERLPEWGEEVLTIDNDGNYEINFITDDDINKWFYDDIVAWMPLPLPWKGE